MVEWQWDTEESLALDGVNHTVGIAIDSSTALGSHSIQLVVRDDLGEPLTGIHI